MNVFIAKITNRKNVDHILNKQMFTHEDIYNFEEDIAVGAPIFFVFSGDRTKIDWEQGLIGFGRVTKAPYDKGYSESNNRYFRIDIQPIYTLSRPLSPKFTKLHPVYQSELYDVPYVGANHFPNQAIAKTSGKSAEALFLLLKDIDPNSVATLDYDFLDAQREPIWERFIKYLEIDCNLKGKTVSNYKSGVKSVCSWFKLSIDDFFHQEIQTLKETLLLVRSDNRDISGNAMYSSAVKKVIDFLEVGEHTNATQSSAQNPSHLFLPKPFLLLAGISGTGKTRFVREQANASAVQFSPIPENHCLVPVRPDWHEPSDLLGYISRIGSSGPRYIVTDLLRFIVAAWKHTITSADSKSITYKPFNSVCPFWLCLDEMNLAPVEQYFADYLSILETRRWDGNSYQCAPIFNSTVIEQLGDGGHNALWVDLKISGEDDKGLRDYFIHNGIPLPPNLIVAGTVNMDETTHGFSRKVIDRALTIDFGEFFPNDYDEFFAPQYQSRILTFSRISHVRTGMFSDEDRVSTVRFLKEVNTILKETPFELAYRALNEILLAVACFNPKTPEELQAVWDDFLMMKVLPRIEGDVDKLGLRDEASLLTRLADLLNSILPSVWEGTRPDLLREHTVGGIMYPIPCRSKRKIEWMQKRLADNGFTAFWP